MTYQQTLDYLFTRLPLFSRIGAAAYKEDLDNTLHICRHLGNPERKFKTIHVAGTNGKGSVSHMLAAILQTTGYKTGLYTSPHLKDFRERIKVDGEMIAESFIIDFTEQIIPVIEDINPSFFEITVGMAFQYFASLQVDIAIIETGLGGRLDSTNVITPEISVITNVSWDHMNLLGDSLEKISYEKAGIIKPNVPAIVGEVIPETQPVFEKTAAAKNATLTIASHQLQALEWKWDKHELIVEVAEKGKSDHRHYHLDLSGLYQVKNLLTVLATCSRLQQSGWHITEANIQTALKQVKKLTGLHGRWEIIHQHPDIILDVGHNEAGIRQVLEQVEVTDHHELHIILGVVKDKEIDSILRLLPNTAHYYFTQAQIPRALDAAALMQLSSAYNLSGKVYPDVNNALAVAKSKANPNDLILICGSIFLIAEVIY